MLALTTVENLLSNSTSTSFHRCQAHHGRHQHLNAQAMADVPLQVVSDNSSSERRITPAWSISTLKAKLEPVTGIPPSYQSILLKTSSQSVAVEAIDEDSTYLASFPLVPYAELHVCHRRLDLQSHPFLEIAYRIGPTHFILLYKHVYTHIHTHIHIYMCVHFVLL